MIRVINERHEREQRLAFLSRYDELTGYLNRAHLLETLGEALARASATRELDRLHDRRPSTISTPSTRSTASTSATRSSPRSRGASAPQLRDGDAIGRFSGDKLGLVLMDCDEDDMHAAAPSASTPRSATRSWSPRPGSVAVTVSIGGVSLPRHGRTPEEAMARAQEALHLARLRATGTSSAYTHSPARQAQRRANAALSTELVAALQERRLSLAFQPVVDIHTRAAALPRGAGPAQPPAATVAASDFAAFAERLGLIRLIDRHVLELALDVLARTDRRISINVSAETVGDSEWMARLTAALAARPDLAERLIVEITETAMISNLEEARDLRRRAARARLPRRDRRFRRRLLLVPQSPRPRRRHRQDRRRPSSRTWRRARDDQVFVRILTELARSFGIATVAEWVQDEETVGCSRASASTRSRED